MASSDNAQDIINAAQALIDQVQGQLAASDEALRRQGLDPQKVRSVSLSQLTPQAADEARAAFMADMEVVEQETREESARQSFGNASSMSPTAAKPAAPAMRRPRTMI